MEAIFSTVLIFSGLWSLLGVITNWDFIMNVRYAGAMTEMIGRTATRMFYGILGTVFVVIGLYLLVT